MKRVLLIEDLPQVAQHLQQMIAREKEAEMVGVERDADAAIERVTTEKPDVVMIDALLQGKTNGFDLAKRVRTASPGTRVIMVTVPQRPVDPKPDQGIDAVFILPGGANELATALAMGKKEALHLKGKMIVCYSPKGGAGKTTIAINLATLLRRRGHSVALMDGVMQFGSIRYALQAPAAARSIVDLPTGQGMRTSLSEVLWEGPSGVAVLLAPVRPEEAELVSAPDVATAMQLLAEDHDYVVVDAGSRLADETLALLDAADVILLVVTYMQASVANTRAAVDTFEALGYKGQKPILLVVNQSDSAAGMSKGGIEHTLNLPVVAEIPTDLKLVSESLNKQQPFVLTSPNAPISKAIDALANTLVQQQRR
jgi:pilus assembly protein CpaE